MVLSQLVNIVMFCIAFINIMLFNVMTNGVKGNVLYHVWMCTEASHTSDKVEFHVIYVWMDNDL